MNINNTVNTPNITYEFYTINTDSTTYGVNNNYTTSLFNPLKDVVQVSIINAVFSVQDTSTSPVAYLTVNELQSQFNEITGNAHGTSDVLTVSAWPEARAQLQNPIASFPISGSDNVQIYKQGDFSTQTQFISPIKKIDKLTCKLWAIDGQPLSLYDDSAVHITFRFTCLRSNLGPNKKRK